MDVEPGDISGVVVTLQDEECRRLRDEILLISLSAMSHYTDPITPLLNELHDRLDP